MSGEEWKRSLLLPLRSEVEIRRHGRVYDTQLDDSNDVPHLPDYEADNDNYTWHEDKYRFRLQQQELADQVPDIDLVCNETLDSDEEDEWSSVWNEPWNKSYRQGKIPDGDNPSKGSLVTAQENVVGDNIPKLFYASYGRSSASSELETSDSANRISTGGLPSCYLDSSRDDCWTSVKQFGNDREDEVSHPISKATDTSSDSPKRDMRLRALLRGSDEDYIEKSDLPTVVEVSNISQEVPDLEQYTPPVTDAETGDSDSQSSDSNLQAENYLIPSTQSSATHSENADELRELLSCDPGDHIVPCSSIEE